jgi:hypothetical protein
MKDVTVRGLDNAVKILISTPEFDRLRAFLTANASQGDNEQEEIIKFIGDEIRGHLLFHHKAVTAAMRPK